MAHKPPSTQPWCPPPRRWIKFKVVCKSGRCCWHRCGVGKSALVLSSRPVEWCGSSVWRDARFRSTTGSRNNLARTSHFAQITLVACNGARAFALVDGPPIFTSEVVTDHCNVLFSVCLVLFSDGITCHFLMLRVHFCSAHVTFLGFCVSDRLHVITVSRTLSSPCRRVHSAFGLSLFL